MMKNLRRFAGVTLFEMLLVMVIISMIVVAGIRYVKHQQEIAADQAYGLKLYTFGQAVNSYVAHSPSLRTSNLSSLPGPAAADGTPTKNPDPSISIGTDPATGGKMITVKGVDWLKAAQAGTFNGVPFLDESFSFNAGMAPLIVARDDGSSFEKGDDAFTTTISFVDPSNPQSSAFNIAISAAVLYEVPAGQNKKPVPMVALSQDAIKHANEMYTSYQGAAAIIYSLPPIGDGTPPTQATGKISSLAQSGDAFLRVDGTNYMDAAIQFDPNSSAQYLASIENLNEVDFYPDGNAEITGLQTLSFLTSNDAVPVGQGKIQSLNNLTMINNAGTPSQIANLSTLTFTEEANMDAKIDNLGELNFVPASTIAGKPGVPASPKKTVCSTTGIKGFFTKSGTVSTKCVVTPATAGSLPIPSKTVGGGQITGLAKITFGTDGPYFTGIKVIKLQPHGVYNSSSSKSNTNETLYSAGTEGNLYPSNSICMLASVGFYDTATAPGVNRECYIAASGDNGRWAITYTNARSCTATCFGYAL